tara:strand:- start:95 stop:760 length:666 start_codon:yes stop_codon:yes gene_type:complete
MKNKKINLIFDFDSTFIQLETIEILADFALQNHQNKEYILDTITKITNQAMSGKISFDKALKDRISMLDLESRHIQDTSKFLKNKISNSFIQNIDYIKNRKDNCYIISGGFKEIIRNVIIPFEFKENHIYANDLIYEKNNKIMINSNNPLSKNKGKCKIAKNIKGYNIIIGDGYTDYEVKKHGYAEIFIQYIENINRKELNTKADLIANDFQEIIDFIKYV